MSETIKGYCPACGSASLFLGSGGYPTCSVIGCPDPTLVADLLLSDARETEHIVTFREDGFTIRHPLRERVAADLEDCALHASVVALDGPPVMPGRYRARRVGDRWTWEPVRVVAAAAVAALGDTEGVQRDA